jgi:hypothetical protein
MNSNKKLLLIFAALIIAVFAIGCGGESKGEKQADANATKAEKQAKEAKKEAKSEAKQAKKEANQANNMSAEEQKQAKAAAAAQAGEQSAQAQAAQDATDAANAEASASAAAAKAGKKSGGGTASAGGGQSCGDGIQVDADTSCAFAQNVVAAWEKNESSTVRAYSPDTGKTYTMNCSGSQMLTTCTGGVGARVTFTP